MPQFKEGKRACQVYAGNPEHCKGYGECHHYATHSEERQAWNYGFHSQIERMGLNQPEQPDRTETIP